MKSTYLTVNGRSEGLYKEKGSKFIGVCVPCASAEKAKELLAMIQKEHHQARHLCYAYRFGLNGDVYRANDDGEPSNSAGAPILGQLQSFEVTNVFIGVVRYYGGTKLGVGGLINAYRTAAKEALLGARIVEREVFEWVRISFEYISMASVMNILKKYQLEMVDNIFELSCELKTNLPLYKADGIRDELKALKSVEIDSIGTY
ncbi:MAG: YigZ family protein [Crocinitomicaceae bacterium]|nr:YigZ family protein [Crocinitomicaceae bacterium]MDG1657019.1 YigZ family protein [Crocinitomicaceae bacterium]